jgi:hypothetical protein
MSLMSLVELNLVSQTLPQHPVSNVTLSPDIVETAIAQVAAQLIWIGNWS